MSCPLFLRRLAVWLALAALLGPSAGADVVINEIMAASSDRLLRWDANGVPYLGWGTRWYATAFGDANWPTGPGPFGYGTLTNSPTAIATNLQPATQYLTPTTYFRKSFTVSAGQQALTDQVQLVVEYNDGFVAYLNGTEVARRNGGPVNKFIYHDQPAYNREAFAGTAPIPTTTNTETINLGTAAAKLAVGTNVLAIHLLNASASDATYYLKASLQIASASPVALVNYNDTWKYLPGVVEPSGNLYDPTQLGSGKQNVLWGQLSYDDLTWASGAGPHGFGSVGTLGTNTQTAMLNATPSLYTRLVFSATAAQAADPLALKLVVSNDDGFIAYINGVEVARRRIGVANTFTPHDAVADSDQSSVQTETITLDAASKLLVAGNNVLAIQTHNYTAGNADFLIKADLQNNALTTTYAANNATWKYFVGTAEPDATVVSDEEQSTPDGPDTATDWIELYNNGASDVSLLNWSLTDDALDPAKWVLPSVTIPAGGYLVIVADNLDLKSNPGGYLHTNFKLSADGEYLGLYNQSGAAVSVLAPGFPKMTPFQSYARNGGGALQYSDTPTPGAVNAGPYSTAIVATPTVNNPGRHYTPNVSVTLSCATAGATIRYTLDGTEPAATSTVASTPLPFSVNTVLRARAFLAGAVPSDTITHTYLVNQSTARKSLPAACLTGDGSQAFFRPFGVFAIVNNNTNAASPPTNYTGAIWSNHPNATSLVAGNAGFTAEDPSLYNAPMQSGKPAERPVSFEILHTDATADLRTGTFLRCAGSPYSRQRYIMATQNSASPNPDTKWTVSATEKPQLNLFFRDDLGQSPLTYPLVPGSVVTQYDNIRLRAGKNDISNPFFRDEFARRLMLDMGQVTVRGGFVNLYLNGLFKGYYNICERPREPFFQEARGTSHGFDVRNITVIVDGDTLAYNELINYARTKNMAVYADYQGMTQRLDVTNLADYLILNSHAAMWDWPGNNYVMDRERATDGVFRFSVWDAEGCYGMSSRTPVYNSFTTDIISGSVSTESVPAKLLYTQLKNSPDWRLAFADRLQKHFFNNGAMVESKMQALFTALSGQIQPIMTEVQNQTVTNFINIWLNGQGTSTRYTLAGGTTGSVVNMPTRRNAMFDGYIDDTQGGITVQGQYRVQGLWPVTLAPGFSQNGGSIGTGINLTMTNPNGSGTIYYTLTGLDPRAPGSGTPGTAQGVSYGAAIPISQTTVVKARVLNGAEWSPLTEATFTASATVPILITELHYNPLPQGATDGDEFEFIELKNVGATTVQLNGVHFTAGVTFAFPAGAALAPGAFAVLAKNAAQFATRYPAVTLAGEYGDKLSNGGETVTLADAANTTIFSVTYSDSAPWPGAADGSGYSLVPVQPNTNPNPNNAANWRASVNVGGSPGQNEPNIAPLVNAGADVAGNLTGVSLAGTATDDSQPNPPLTLTFAWSQTSGPGTATFTPANALATSVALSLPGIYTLRLAVNDSALTGTDDVTVFAKDTAAAWLARHPGIGTLNDDPDGDGRTNYTEFALGTDPTAPDAGTPPATTLENGHLTATYTRLKPPSTVVYAIEVADVITAFRAANPGELTEQILADDGLVQTVKVTDTVVSGGQTQRFLRLKITPAP